MITPHNPFTGWSENELLRTIAYFESSALVARREAIKHERTIYACQTELQVRKERAE